MIEWQICSRCNGCGEGNYEGTICRTCRGRGEVQVEVLEPEPAKDLDTESDEC
jgi:DnaJ-class molecular chaperone